MTADGEQAGSDRRRGAEPAGGDEVSGTFAWKPSEASSLPQRYRVSEVEGETFISCDEAPRMRVQVRRDFAFSLERARALGPRVILLDGAGSFGPLLDNKAKLYNLDHHAGCERTFTLATCEQALLLVQSGLDLKAGDWTVYANEPDLDTVLAIWCLLNHERVRDLRPDSREILFPLLRLEGAIDANGPELAQFCGLSSATLESARRRLDQLIVREQEAKKRGEWRTFDFERFTIEVLNDIDHQVYSIEDFREYASIEELYGHIEIGKKQLAVVCRDAGGVYEVERLLKARWGDQLALIALENEPRHYTLRRASTLATIDLNDAYRMLNLLDPAVDGRPPQKRWGGSDAIGGSPRPSGSNLAPRDLLRIVERAFQKKPPRRALIDLARACGWTAIVAGVSLLAGFAWWLLPGVIDPLRDEVARIATSAAIVGAAALLLTRRFSGRRAWLFGFRRPAVQGAWLPLGAVAIAAALPIRAWLPLGVPLEPISLLAGAAAVALAVTVMELWFRGVVHGLLLFDGRVQSPDGPWRISFATGAAAVLYGATALLLSLPAIALAPSPFGGGGLEVALVGAAALIGGLSLGVLRERSLSLWPGVVAQIAGSLGGFALWGWLAG